MYAVLIQKQYFFAYIFHKSLVGIQRYSIQVLCIRYMYPQSTVLKFVHKANDFQLI